MPDVPVIAAPTDALLAAIVASSSDAILSKDLNGTITSWNAGAERIFGYTAEEVLGRHVTVLFPAGRYDEEPAILARIKSGERIEHYETVRRRKNGTLLDVSLSVSPIRDATGRIVGASKVARDITAIKRTQERFQVTLDSISDAVIATDEAGRVNFLNPAAAALTGWTEAEAEGRALPEVLRLLDEDTGKDLRATPIAAVLAGGPAVGPLRHVALVGRDGSQHPVECTLNPIQTGADRRMGLLAVFRDISAVRAAEITALRLAAIIEGSDDAIVGKNLQGIVTNWNPGAERLFGYTEAEMIGQSILRLLPADRLNEEQQILARLQRGERVDHFETVRVRKDGTTVDVSLSISPIRDREGVIIGASKIARDITALRVAQEKLKNHAVELEVKVRERSRKLEETVAELEAFSYSLSHDMRAPLRAIQSFTEIVLMDFGDKIPEGVPYLNKVVNASGRMDRLIQDVLAFTRLANADIQLAPVDVERLVREIIHERPELQAPGAHVVIKGRIPLIIGHDASLTQCLTNLLHNAVKFVPSGTIPEVEVYGELHEGRVRVCIRDNGIGIDPQGQKRLFAIFQRLSTNQPYHGSGIGLAIVRKAAERMKGSVGVESTPGKGSTFWVELSAAP